MKTIQYKKRRKKVTELSSLLKLPLKPIIRKIRSYQSLKKDSIPLRRIW